jgi:hypothetical protein
MFFYFSILQQCSVKIFMKQVKNFNRDFYEFVSVKNFMKDAPTPRENPPTGL